MTSFTIAPYDGVGFTQTFAPAYDGSWLHLPPGLCGPYDYQVVCTTSPPVTILFTIAPTVPGSEYTANWSLTALSTDLADIGAYTCYVQVQYSTINYASAVPLNTTYTFTVTVVDPCPSALIVPEVLGPMTLTIFDSFPTIQTFAEWGDSVSNAAGITNICGTKTYSSNQVLAVISGSSSLWSISSQTSNPLDVTSYTVIITASITSQPTVVPV
jgi:hypothetical protein